MRQLLHHLQVSPGLLWENDHDDLPCSMMSSCVNAIPAAAAAAAAASAVATVTVTVTTN